VEAGMTVLTGWFQEHAGTWKKTRLPAPLVSVAQWTVWVAQKVIKEKQVTSGKLKSKKDNPEKHHRHPFQSNWRGFFIQ
jgi:hypothetical protein